MIYAIRAVGTKFVKIGRAGSVGKRLKELDTGCPHELHIEAVADWPDGQETAIHAYLARHSEKLEWFRDGDSTATVIAWMLEGESGLRAFRVEFLKFISSQPKLRLPLGAHREYIYPSKPDRSRSRVTVDMPTGIPLMVSNEDRLRAHDRYEQIKLKALAKKARAGELNG